MTTDVVRAKQAPLEDRNAAENHGNPTSNIFTSSPHAQPAGPVARARRVAWIAGAVSAVNLGAIHWTRWDTP